MRWWLLLWFLATPASAEMVLAARTIAPGTLITPELALLAEGTAADAIADPADAIGREARVVIYAGRPIRATDIGAPAIVDRNQSVALIYRRGSLTIRAEGRALGRGGAGDIVRAMNIGSRTTVSGIVAADGSIVVAGN